MFQATRRRLAIWYTAVTAVLLLLFATGVYLYVRATLIDRVDDTLKHVVEVVERSIVIETVPPQNRSYRVNVEASFRNNANTVEDDRIDLEWFSPRGELLWSTFSEPLHVPLHPSIRAKTVHYSQDLLLRQVTKTVETEDNLLGYLRVSHPWFEVTKPIHRLILDLSGGISLMLLCTAAIGWLLSGIAIKPVRDSYQSLKQFTADASHELRNPIAMIQTNVQMALAYTEKEPQLQQKQLKVIERLTQRLGHLVNDLLFLARSDSGIVKIDFQPVPLDALLMEVIEEQRIIAQQKEVSLSLSIIEPDLDDRDRCEDVFTLQGDWEQLARLFTNLIGNALQYCQHQTASVEVELELVKRDRSPQLQVKVRDTGIGIPAEALPHIFDRFYRVTPYSSNSHTNFAVKGSGLGLAIASAIVENHRGQISAESVVDRGTTFTVVLPVASEGS
ncbi:MAG: HAMP domain-containing sensor histidine kinase [Prochloraceae cyanobacterium]|nr:HAMP domain-containing sensor histidine kinase [Prochloraceae cyanobacterium]